MAGPLNQQYWYKCNQCYYINQNPFNLAYHLKCHTRNQRIKCPLFNYILKNADINSSGNPEIMLEKCVCILHWYNSLDT